MDELKITEQIMDDRVGRHVKDKWWYSEILLGERTNEYMSLAQGIQIGLLGNGVIDNYAACTASNKKKKKPHQINGTQDCTTIKLGENFSSHTNKLSYGNNQTGGNGHSNNWLGLRNNMESYKMLYSIRVSSP